MGDEALRREIRKLMGTSYGFHIVDAMGEDPENRSVLGCMYPEGSTEATLEEAANKLLADLTEEDFDFGFDSYVRVLTPAEHRKMVERFTAVRSQEELVSLVNEYRDEPEAYELAAGCLIKHQWATQDGVRKYWNGRIAV